MKTEWLNEWEMLAIQAALEAHLERGALEAISGKALIAKIEASSHVRLSFKTALVEA